MKDLDGFTKILTLQMIGLSASWSAKVEVSNILSVTRSHLQGAIALVVLTC